MKSNRNNTSSKPFCKVCFDAGKSETLYTNHFVKSNPGPNGNVVCPTLLSMKCSYCKENGHTVKYCMKATATNNNHKKEKTKHYYKIDTSASKEAIKKTVSVSKTNRFETLIDDDDELEDGEEKDEYPALCNYSTTTTTQTKFIPTESSYAIAASKPPMIVDTTVKHDFKTHRWADDELTDDEDDEIRMKYKRICKPPLKNNFIIHDHDKYDDLSDTSYHSYDVHDYDDDYSENYLYDRGYVVADNDEDDIDYYDYAPADILNSVTCVRWKNSCH